MCVAIAAGAAGAIGSIASVAGTIIGAMGAIQQGNAAAASAQYQAQVANNNAILADRAASDAVKRGEAAEERERQKTAQVLSRQRAVLSANGVDITSGSPLAMFADTAMIGELDAKTVKDNFLRERSEHEARAMNFRSEATLAEMKGQQAKSASKFSAFGTVLTGMGSVAEKWYKLAA